ncbi:MAG: NAD(P)/FAD-dependent oxidoreductase [Spirochaetaceae bacterium]|nr:NAD(P)/FAD-dependent oxidoreductase [Spirochaetaceae bacterium]
MSKDKVIIIGAGVSGLSAGIYAARSGFSVEIFEQHTIAGGFCSNWKRKGFYFEGGLHWLNGSSDKVPLHRVWKEVGALQDNNPIELRDPFATLLTDTTSIKLWRNVHQLKAELLEKSPEDKKMIVRLCNDIKAFQGVHMLVKDIPGLKVKNKSKVKFSELLAMVPAAFRFFPLFFTSYTDYVAKFKNENLRKLLFSLVGSYYNALSFIFTLSSVSMNDSGFPLGGSLQMVQNMQNEFIRLGGKIHFSSQVRRICFENKKVVGIELKDGSICSCSDVIITQDAKIAVEKLFPKKITSKWVKNLEAKKLGSQNIFIGMGIKGDFSHLPHTIVLPLEKELTLAGCNFSSLKLYNYSHYKDYAPEGCTTFTSILLCQSYEYWKAAKEEGCYKEKKQEVFDAFITAIQKAIPEISAENLVVFDVATPLTYERYCSSYKGSWMTVWEKGKKQTRIPQKMKEYQGVYFAGQRVLLSGGLPIAVSTGRKAVQYLCKDKNQLFV